MLSECKWDFSSRSIARPAEHEQRAQSAAQPAAAGRKKAVPFPDGRGFTQAEAKVYLPESALLSKEREWHHRWKVTFKHACARHPPKSLTFNSPEDDNRALKDILIFAWSVHSRITGEECPWVLDGEIL